MRSDATTTPPRRGRPVKGDAPVRDIPQLMIRVDIATYEALSRAAQEAKSSVNAIAKTMILEALK